MSRITRALTTAVLALATPSASALASSSGAPGAPAVVASPSVASPGGSTGIAKFGACLSGKRTADVVLLLDESGSLQQSDPGGARVDAAKYLVKQWSALSSESGVTIAIQTMGFADDVMDGSGKWLDASEDYSQVKADLEQFRGRNHGQQTDYWMALDGARKALAQRSQKGGSTCQAILWFSDGKLDAFATFPAVVNGKAVVALKPYLEDKGTSNAAATAAASKDLCRRGGVADQVRSSGIATFAVGLAAGTAVPADFDLMKAIALGDNGCGAVPAAGTGDFHLATDIDELILAFDAVRSPGQLPLVQRLGVCQGEVCPAHSHRFVLDSSITRVHIAASASVEGLKLFIVSPKRKAVEVPTTGEQDTHVDAATVHSEGLSKRTTSLDLTATGDWTGVWAVVFVDPDKGSGTAKSVTSLELSGDIEPSVTLPSAKIYAGEKSAPVSFGLKHHDGTVIDPSSLLGSVRVDATFTDSAGTEIPVATGLDAAALAAPLPLDLTSAAEGKGSLTVTASLTTAPVKPAKGATIPGTQLKAASSDFDVTILPPVGFPSVADRVDFGTATGAAKADGSIKATGPGCVWFDAAKVIAAPEQAGTVGLTSAANSAQSCVKLADGESKDIAVTFTTGSPANGAVNGTVTAHLAPADEPGRAHMKPVKFTANLDKPPNGGMKWLMFVLCLGAGLGIPLGLMYLSKSMASKIPPLPLVGGVFDIAVEGGQVTRNGMPFEIAKTELRDPIPITSGGAKRLTIGPALLKVRNGWLPFGAGMVLATVAGATGISKANTSPRKDGAAELPLAIHNNWALFNAPERGPGQGRLLLLASADASPEKRADMVAGALADIPQRLASLAGSASTTGGGGMVDPGGSGSGGPRLVDPDSAWAGGGSGNPWATAPTSGSQGGDPWAQTAGAAGAASSDPWGAAFQPNGSGSGNPWTDPGAGGPAPDPWATSALSAPTPNPDPWGAAPVGGAAPDPWATPSVNPPGASSPQWPPPPSPGGVDQSGLPAMQPPGQSATNPWASGLDDRTAPLIVPPGSPGTFGPPSEATAPVHSSPDDPQPWMDQERGTPAASSSNDAGAPTLDFSNLTFDDPRQPN